MVKTVIVQTIFISDGSSSNTNTNDKDGTPNPLVHESLDTVPEPNVYFKALMEYMEELIAKEDPLLNSYEHTRVAYSIC
jgi:hypothetical protein